MMNEDKAKKFDSGKIRLELLPTESLEEIAKVLMFGANKYGEYNWRGGMHWSRLMGATLRHCFKWISGETYDQETGITHLAHAATDLLFLISYQKNNVGTDDRHDPIKSVPTKIPEGEKFGYHPSSDCVADAEFEEDFKRNTESGFKDKNSDPVKLEESQYPNSYAFKSYPTEGGYLINEEYNQNQWTKEGLGIVTYHADYCYYDDCGNLRDNYGNKVEIDFKSAISSTAESN
jgi:hypothetical protein